MNTAELREVVGEQGVLTLAKHFGGKRLSIPLTARTGHPVEVLIGSEAFRALCDRIGAESLYVPKLSRMRRQLQIREHHQLAVSSTELAVQLGIPPSTIRRLRRSFFGVSTAMRGS